MTPVEPTTTPPRWELRTPLSLPFGTEGVKQLRCEDCNGSINLVFWGTFMHFCRADGRRSSQNNFFGSFVYSSLTHAATSLTALAGEADTREVRNHPAAPFRVAA